MRFIYYRELSLPFCGRLVRRGNVPSPLFGFLPGCPSPSSAGDINHLAQSYMPAPVISGRFYCLSDSVADGAVARRTIDNERQLRENAFIPVCKTSTIVALFSFFSISQPPVNVPLLRRYSAAFSPSFPECRRGAMAVGCTVVPWINGPSVVVLSHKAIASRHVENGRKVYRRHKSYTLLQSY